MTPHPGDQPLQTASHHCSVQVDLIICWHSNFCNCLHTCLDPDGDPAATVFICQMISFMPNNTARHIGSGKSYTKHHS
jgi:hypothetical protein